LPSSKACIITQTKPLYISFSLTILLHHSYVGQEPVLFSGSIADNIAYGIDRSIIHEDDETVRSRVIAAAKLANAHDFISAFPQVGDAVLCYALLITLCKLVGTDFTACVE
jgi:ABC-type multidrug transport system fused ATPase/permease subunit